MSNYTYDPNELYHHGTLGMRWGVHKAVRAKSANDRMSKRVTKYEKKAADYYKRSERVHAAKDLGRANRSARLSAKYQKKAAKLEKKRDDSAPNSNQYYKLNQRAAGAKMNASYYARQANAISRRTGYGKKAERLAYKSDKFAAKAGVTRYKMAKNDKYIARMKEKASGLSANEINNGYSFVKRLYHM